MRSFAFISALAFAASASAQVDGFAAVDSPTDGSVVPAGETFTIKWEAGDYTGNVAIGLIGGATQGTQVKLQDITTGVDITTQEFAWAVDCSLGADAVYGLTITSEDDASLFQYSFPFQIKGPSCSSSSSSSSSDVATPTGYPVVTPTPTASSSSSSYPVSTPVETPSYPVESSSTFVTVSTSTSATYPVVTPSSNSTTSTPVSSSYSASSSAPASSSPSAPLPVPTAAAPKHAAGSIALVAGVAAAVFAL